MKRVEDMKFNEKMAMLDVKIANINESIITLEELNNRNNDIYGIFDKTKKQIKKMCNLISK